MALPEQPLAKAVLASDSLGEEEGWAPRDAWSSWKARFSVSFLQTPESRARTAAFTLGSSRCYPGSLVLSRPRQ